MATAIAGESDSKDGGIFQWSRGKRTWMHLLAFFCVSILVHGSGFYLFQVVYPSPARVEINSGAITMLDSSDPVARAVLQRIEDRTVFLLPPSEGTEVRVSLDDSRIRFVPAFSRTDLALKPLPREEGIWENPAPREDWPETADRVEVSLESGLSGRALAPWSTISDYFSLAESFPAFRARVVVATDGGVEVVGIESELEESEEEGLAEVVESILRFLPADSTDQGWIEVRQKDG